MSESTWYCNKCGSDNVSQQWSFYAPMNKELDLIVDAQRDDVYWREVCNDSCDPVKK